VAAGPHRVEVEQKGFLPYKQDVEAKFGRAIIVDAQLERSPDAPTTPPDKPPETPPASDFDAPKRISVSADTAIVFSKLGAYGQGARFGLSLEGAYWLMESGRLSLGAGLRFDFTGDSWSNTISAPNIGPGCTRPILVNESSTEVSGFAVGVLGYRAFPRIRIGADLGLGLSAYTAGILGGDLFYASCSPSTGAQVATHGSVNVSYAVLPILRVVATPLSLQIHPAYGDTRTAPVDASGAWVRLAMGIGAAVDF
jgi:hypothetical protein